MGSIGHSHSSPVEGGQEQEVPSGVMVAGGGEAAGRRLLVLVSGEGWPEGGEEPVPWLAG